MELFNIKGRFIAKTLIFYSFYSILHVFWRKFSYQCPVELLVALPMITDSPLLITVCKFSLLSIKIAKNRAISHLPIG